MPRERIELKEGRIMRGPIPRRRHGYRSWTRIITEAATQSTILKAGGDISISFRTVSPQSPHRDEPPPPGPCDPGGLR